MAFRTSKAKNILTKKRQSCSEVGHWIWEYLGLIAIFNISKNLELCYSYNQIRNKTEIVPLSKEAVNSHMKVGDYVELERSVGEPLYRQNGRTIRPVSRVLKLWWRPFGGRVWNWPVAIAIEENGVVQEVPVVHINRWAEIGIGVTVFVFSLLIWIVGKSRS